MAPNYLRKQTKKNINEDVQSRLDSVFLEPGIRPTKQYCTGKMQCNHGIFLTYFGQVRALVIIPSKLSVTTEDLVAKWSFHLPRACSWCRETDLTAQKIMKNLPNPSTHLCHFQLQAPESGYDWCECTLVLASKTHLYPGAHFGSI